MVEWLAGKRVRGTSSERTPLGTVLGGTGVGGWVELGRTTLGGAADSLEVSSLADKRYYMILHWVVPDTYVAPRLRLGNSSVDTGSNYARRGNENGGTDGTATSQDHITFSPEGGGNPQYTVGYIANSSANEKLFMNHTVHRKAAGEANEPGRGEVVGKWSNTSNPLDLIHLYNGDPGSGDYASGSELVVLGWDPDDTHTNNFWEELADVSWSSGSSFDTGTFTAKKYLWVQFWTDSATTNYRPLMTVGNSTLDTGTNYATRRSFDGATDVTSASRSDWETEMDGTANIKFGNMFIINNASNEKLSIGHFVSSTTAGAAAAPSRREMVGKWDNTSNQINIIGLTTSTGDFTGGQIKVWGAD